MDTLFFDHRKSLGFLTIAANRLLCARLRRMMTRAGIDLTAEQWGVLVLIWNRGGLSQDEAAREVCVDKSSMSRVLSGMERKGLITRQADPSNARRKILRTTPKADAFKERSREVTVRVLDSALADVSPEDRDTCLEVLSAVCDRLKHVAAHSGAASPKAPETAA